jgi:hypothetical protein
MRKKKAPENTAPQEAPAAQPEPSDVILPPADRKGSRKCVVCGGDVAPLSEEELCWVCRRLKISAWRESDNQQPMQE